ncbi:MAG: hypothetical protein AB1896_21870 [Thermodesulfobacteriota bacterium]
MKKGVVFILAALLLAAFAVPAMAETKTSFSGNYTVWALYVSNPVLAGQSEDEDKASYFAQRFRLFVDFAPSENLILHLKTEAVDQEFGGNQGIAANAYGTQATSSGQVLSTADTTGSLEVYNAYMEIKTQVGAFYMGRMLGGTGGLANIGYTTGYKSWSPPFDTLQVRDRFKWIMPVGNLTLIAVWDKRREEDFSTGAGNRATNLQDQDYDIWDVSFVYKFANGAITSDFAWLRSRWGRTPATAVAQQTDWDALVINPAFILNFGPFGIHGEIQYMDGEMDRYPQAAGQQATSMEGFQYFIDFTYNYGPGTVGVLYLYAQGDDPNTANTNEGALGGWGADYDDALVLHDWALCNANTFAAAGGTAGTAWVVGMQDLGFFVNHSLTEDLMLSAALHFLWLDEPGTTGGQPNSDDYGTAFTVGFTYNLMANLIWDLDFEYFAAGDWFKQAGTVAQIGDAWGMINTLTMTF